MRNKAIKFSLVAGALLSISGAAAAQPGEDGTPGGPRGVQTREEAVARADRMFDRLDANRDGRVTADEARQAMAGRMGERGPRGPEGMRGRGGPGGHGRAEMFDRLDRDHNGMISREEFAQLPPPPGSGGPDGPGGPGGRRGPGRGMMAMQMFGPNGATREEFRAHALERFNQRDANHDGLITPDERPQRRGPDAGHPEPEGD